MVEQPVPTDSPLRARTVGAPSPAALESLAAFLLERLEADAARRPQLLLVTNNAEDHHDHRD